MAALAGSDIDEHATAIAQDNFGCAIYASLGSGWFRPVPHFPSTAEEAAVLYEYSLGPKLQLDELQAVHDGALTIVRI